METCANCSTRVFPKTDGSCPSCGKAIAATAAASQLSSQAQNAEPPTGSQGSSTGPFKNEWHRRTQKKIDVGFGVFIVLIATIGMGVIGFVIADQEMLYGIIAAGTTVSLLGLGALCAHKDRFRGVFGILTTLVFLWALYVFITKGKSWTPYFLAFNAEMAFFTGGRVYDAMIAKWARGA